MLPNLDIDSNYTVKVFAFNSKGESNGTFDMIYPDRLGMILYDNALFNFKLSHLINSFFLSFVELRVNLP